MSFKLISSKYEAGDVTRVAIITVELSASHFHTKKSNIKKFLVIRNKNEVSLINMYNKRSIYMVGTLVSIPNCRKFAGI